MLKKFFVATVLVISLAFAGEVAGQTPTPTPVPGLVYSVSVTGADASYDIGSLIVLKAEIKNPPAGFVKATFKWFKIVNNAIVEPDFQVSTDTTTVSMGTGKTVRDLNLVIIPVVDLNDGKTETIDIPKGGTTVVVHIIDLAPPTPPTDTTSATRDYQDEEADWIGIRGRHPGGHRPRGVRR